MKKQKSPQEEIGCGRYFKNDDRRCGGKYGYYRDEERDYTENKEYDIWLCLKCQIKEAISNFAEKIKILAGKKHKYTTEAFIEEIDKLVEEQSSGELAK